MHELAIVQELIKLAEVELSRARFEGKVKVLTIKVGKLSGASPEALQFAFEAVAPSTRLKGARLDIEEPKPMCRCLNCGFEQEVDGYLFECPACGSGDIVIDGGRDLRLDSLEVED
jgi:hydrogenase nickel incorporation protein HypA/HybF